MDTSELFTKEEAQELVGTTVFATRDYYTIAAGEDVYIKSLYPHLSGEAGYKRSWTHCQIIISYGGAEYWLTKTEYEEYFGGRDLLFRDADNPRGFWE